MSVIYPAIYGIKESDDWFQEENGPVALIMALYRAIKNQNRASVYDERGILL